LSRIQATNVCFMDTPCPFGGSITVQNFLHCR
jgi:hypothetical protein